MVGIVVDVLVGGGASVVLTGVFVGLDAGVRDGVREGKPGSPVVGMGVCEGTITVSMGVIICPVGAGVSLRVGVVVWLGVMLEKKVGVPVAVLVPVKVMEKAASQGTTPANPRLYASNTLNSRVPFSRSLSVTWLPPGCCTSQP